MDAVRRAYAGSLQREFGTVQAAVVADYDALFPRLVSLGNDQPGKGLRRPAHDVHIHAVKADAHGAAQSGGTEFQRPAEAAFDLRLVACNGVELLPFRLGQRGAV